MCEQCEVNPLYFGDPLPGWLLIRARRESEMKVGQWGLVQCNDPTFVWTTTPAASPIFGMSDSEIEAYEKVNGFCDEWAAVGDDFIDSLVHCGPMDGYRIVDACMQVGYDSLVHGDVIVWLFSYLGKWITENEPTTEEDPFPHLDEMCPHDYNLGKN